MTAAPVWSVVVPTFNRPDRLAACVRALAALQPPAGGYEIVVVNDGGVAPPAEVRALAGAGNALSAQFLERPNGGPAAARNDGATAAQGRWLAFTDDDCEPEPDWLVRLDRAFADAPDVLAGGLVVNALRSNLYSEASHLLADFVMAWFDGSGRERFLTTNNVALPRAAFHEIGGFDASFRRTGEDREFCDRWHAAGRPSIVVPDARIRHSHELTLATFLGQHFAYGAGARAFRAVRKDTGRPVRVSPSFYGASVLHAWRAGGPLRGALLSTLTILAHCAYMAGLGTVSLRGDGTRSAVRGPHANPGDASQAVTRGTRGTMRSMPDPTISVILPTWDTFDALRTTIAHLCRQTIAGDIELLICAPGADRFEVDRDAVAPLHSVQILEAGDLSATGPARGRAIRMARAPVVAFTEDHSFPEPQWAEALVQAHAEPHAAVAPAIRNGNPETIVSWADLMLGYGRWLAPGRRGVMDLLPGHNVSYKRAVLMEYDADLDRLMEAETVLLWDLRRRGHTLLFEPAAVTAHHNFSRMRVWLDAQWHLGRVFAATRAAGWPTAKRLGFALASPAIPFIRLMHVVRYGIRNGVPAGRIAATLPCVSIGLVVDFLAQACGTLFGAGRSVARLAAYEFHRAEVNRTGRPPARAAV